MQQQPVQPRNPNNPNQRNFFPRTVGGSIHPMQLGGGNRFGGRNDKNNNERKKRIETKRPNPFGDKKLKTIDYLDAKSLLKFTNSQGKILPKRINGTTAYQQREITKAIKHARHLALLSFVGQDLS